MNGKFNLQDLPEKPLITSQQSPAKNVTQGKLHKWWHRQCKHGFWCLPTKNRFEHFEPKLFKLSFTGIYQNEGLQRKMFGNRKLKNKSYNSIQFNLSESRQHFKLQKVKHYLIYSRTKIEFK